MARLWIVDDDPTCLSILGGILRPMGHELVLFHDGSELLKRLQDPQEAVPDLILMDVMMPGCDGYTLHQKLRDDSRFRRVPVIVMTAKSNMRELFSPEQGVVAFLEKPIKFSLLRDTVTNALEGKGTL
ncbi:MAG: response regulator [Elusimicrobia bacterium]|nr:response regulator [Elusimicrobiota bacterium]